MLRRQHLTILSAMVMLAACSGAGCSSKAGWQYTANPAQPGNVQIPVTVAVERFKDQRGNENSHYFFLCAIPLVPYCSASYNQPENANGFLTAAAYNFRPSADLAEATALELRQTGAFREVFVTDRDVEPGAQLEIHGTILNTDWNGSAYAYLLGPYAPLLWIFGLPIGSAHNAVSVRLELIETASGLHLWSTEINQTYSTTEGLYYDYATDFGYPQIYLTGMQSAVASLETYLAQQPPTFWQHHASNATH